MPNGDRTLQSDLMTPLYTKHAVIASHEIALIISDIDRFMKKKHFTETSSKSFGIISLASVKFVFLKSFELFDDPNMPNLFNLMTCDNRLHVEYRS